MRQFIRLFTCLVLAAVTACSSAVIGALAAQTESIAETTFTCIEDVDAAVQKIFSDNKETIIAYARQLNDLNIDDAYYTYYCGSCGPTSKALQKVLADNGIYVEERKQNVNTEMHAYNLMRVSFDGGETVTNIVIDPTYKQTMRDYFRKLLSSDSAEEIDRAIESADLPDVNVFEFGDKAALDERINSCLDLQGLPHFDVTPTFGYYEPVAYPEYELQATYDTFLTPAQLAQIRDTGHLNKPFSSDLFLTSADGSLRYPMIYESNGIYTCLIQSKDFGGQYAKKFTVQDENGSVIYGGADGLDVSGYYSYHFSYCSRKQQQFLSRCDTPFTVSCCDPAMLLRIDVRAGVDAPVINLLPVHVHLRGDLNDDGVIDEKDIALAESGTLSYLAGCSMDSDSSLAQLKAYVATGEEPSGKIGLPFYSFTISSFCPLLLEI